MDGNQHRIDVFRAKTEVQSPKKGKRERSYLRSLLLIFVIVAIAATVVELRKPAADKAQTAFTDLVYQQMEAQKAELWLGKSTAQELLTKDGWITADDIDADVRRTAATLLGLPHVSFSDAPVLNWNGLKSEEAARLWELWQAQPEGQSELDFINSQLALHKQNKTLPGLGENLWMINGMYLLAVDDGTVGICLLSDLKNLD